MDDKEKIELEEKIIHLESVKGRHTELVTVMIPAGFNVIQVIRQLEAEKSTAANIKSKATRSAVTDSLDAITVQKSVDCIFMVWQLKMINKIKKIPVILNTKCFTKNLFFINRKNCNLNQALLKNRNLQHIINDSNFYNLHQVFLR